MACCSDWITDYSPLPLEKHGKKGRAKKPDSLLEMIGGLEMGELESGDEKDQGLIGYLNDIVIIDNNRSDEQVPYLSNDTFDNHSDEQVSSLSNDTFDTDAIFDFKKSTSLSKSAVAARENRLRKKNYVANLEKNVQGLKTENSRLKQAMGTMKKQVGSLSVEVQYLKSVLANQSTLSSLLQNINATPGLKFLSSIGIDDSDSGHSTNYKSTDSDSSSNIASRRSSLRNTTKNSFNKRPASAAESSKVDDHGYAQTRSSKLQKFSSFEDDMKNVKTNNIVANEHAGVCLHVSDKVVSFEFCSSCSEKAKQAKQMCS